MRHGAGGGGVGSFRVSGWGSLGGSGRRKDSATSFRGGLGRASTI